jgi:hypothetical protein
LSGFLFLYRLGDRPLNSSHEARAAQNAQSILAEDDWLLPQLFDRRVELQKPPLYYWLIALLGALRGGVVDAWAVRLPAALAGLAVVLAVYAFCALRGRPLAGFLAGAILATTLHFTWLARVGRIDMPLTLVVTLTVAGFHLARHESWRRGWLLMAYLSAAAGVLLKGPIAVALPAFVLLASRLVEGRQRQSWRSWIGGLGLAWGLPLVVLLAGPWYLLATVETRGDFFRVFFWHHNVERGFGGDAALSSHPWWLYFARMPVDLFPWSLLLPLAGWWSLCRTNGRSDSEAHLGLAWLASILLLLIGLTFKRADYLLPAYPGAALFLGCTGERWWRALWGRAPTCHASGRSATCPTVPSSVPCFAASGFFLVLLGCMVGWWLYVERETLQAASPAEHLASAIRARTSRTVIFFRTENHELAFQVGRPIDTVLEWENLDVWLAQPRPVYVVMPEDCAVERNHRLKNGRLKEVLRSRDLPGALHHRPLVFLARPEDPCRGQAWAGVLERRKPCLNAKRGLP